MRGTIAAIVRLLLVAAALAAVPAGPASAQNLFDFLFGRPDREAAPPPPMQPLPPRMRPPPQPGASYPPPPPSNFQQQIINSNTGRASAYCVRMCDGRYFPLDRNAGSPVQLCSSFCPASQTKIYNGTDIGHAIASDGTRYHELKTAYLYRKGVVPNCTCNGRDAFGLVTLDVRSDPTLRVGDIIATATGSTTVVRADGRRDGSPDQVRPVTPR